MFLLLQYKEYSFLVNFGSCIPFSRQMCGIYYQNFLWDIRISWELGSLVPRDYPTLEGGRQILPTKEFGHMNMIAMSLILDENWIVLFQFSKPSVQTGSLCDCSLCHGRGGCFVANETGVPFKTIHPPGWRARVEGPVTPDLQVWLNWKIIIMIIKAVLSLKEEH